ncbi:MAG: epoxyqueuosine reductase QueH [Patescibacteria group bacterium]|nr:epoxyqueuosine reductase QueH [Patescibacteria group bacterium]
MNRIAKKSLLLHVCCAPCTTAVYEKLSNDFEITLFWFNPNIEPVEEHEKRLKETIKLSRILAVPLIIDDKYLAENQSWNLLTKDYANEKEGGNRCRLCIKNRLLNTAKQTKDNNFDYFTTTLTVSPHKNSAIINKLGKEIAEKSDVEFLEADFKKENGYLRSIELSKKYDLYRQNYCGCKYSLNNF